MSLVETYGYTITLQVLLDVLLEDTYSPYFPVYKLLFYFALNRAAHTWCGLLFEFFSTPGVATFTTSAKVSRPETLLQKRLCVCQFQLVWNHEVLALIATVMN